MTAALALVAGVLGLLIGSFLNVVIARVPAGESVVSPPSHCPSCDTPIAPRDNIPVLSWLLLRGRCRACAVRISPRYPLVEAGTAALFASTAWSVGPHADLAAHLVVVASFVALSLIDLDTKRLPDVIVLPAFAATTVLLAVAALVDDRWPDLGRAGLGAAIGLGLLGLIHLVAPRGLGFGDVKLAGVCGLLLGWHGLADVVLGLYGGFVLGAVVGGALIALGRARFGRSIPFGPFLAAATLLTALVGGPVADRVRELLAG